MKKLLLLLCLFAVLFITSCGGKNDGAGLPSSDPEIPAAPVSQPTQEPTPHPAVEPAPEPTEAPEAEPPMPETVSELAPGPEENGSDADPAPGESEERDYVLNKNTMKFHVPSCKSAGQIKEKNRLEYTGTREEVIDMGYEPCKNCKP